MKVFKRFLTAALLVAVLSFSVGGSVFAAYDPYEPNNSSVDAYVIQNNKAYYGYLPVGDMDFFKLTPQKNSLQSVAFVPPDEQLYGVGVYDADELDSTGSASPLVWSWVENNEPAILEFYPQAGKAYYILLLGWNIGNDDNSYLLGVSQP